MKLVEIEKQMGVIKAENIKYAHILISWTNVYGLY